MGQPRLEHLRVLCPDLQAASHRGAQDHGDRGQATGHVPQLGGVVRKLVEADAEEVHEHDLGHRSQATQSRSHRRPDDGLFGDGRIAYPVHSVLGGETLRHTEHTVVGDVFTEEHDSVV